MKNEQMAFVEGLEKATAANKMEVASDVWHFGFGLCNSLAGIPHSSCGMIMNCTP